MKENGKKIIILSKFQESPKIGFIYAGDLMKEILTSFFADAMYFLTFLSSLLFVIR